MILDNFLCIESLSNCKPTIGFKFFCYTIKSWIVLLALTEFSSAKSPSFEIYWNTSNPIFRIDNTDHIIDVNRGKKQFEYDQVNIICPHYYAERTDEAETYIIYNVSKEEYDSCRIVNSNARIIAICDKPHQPKYFTITFRSFTPQPGGLEFKPGQDYYFISTSTGKPEGLERRLGGRCSTHHMKVIFKVCCLENSNNIIVPPSTSITFGSLVTTTFPAPPEHWWRPHFIRIQDLKWRSKGPGNVVTKPNHHHSTVGHDPFTKPNSNNSNVTSRHISWTTFVIAYFFSSVFSA